MNKQFRLHHCCGEHYLPKQRDFASNPLRVGFFQVLWQPDMQPRLTTKSERIFVALWFSDKGFRNSGCLLTSAHFINYF